MSPAAGTASSGLALRAESLALRTAESALRVAETALRVAELALAAEPGLRAPLAAAAAPTAVGAPTAVDSGAGARVAAFGGEPRGHASPSGRTAAALRHGTLRGRRRFLGWAVLLHELRRVRAAQRAAGMLRAAGGAVLATAPSSAACVAPRAPQLRSVDPAWLSAALHPATSSAADALPGGR